MWMFGSRTTVKKVRNSLTWFSQIDPSAVCFQRKVKITKEMRFAQHCVAAASQLLTPQPTSALKNAGMQRIFAAPVHANFQLRTTIQPSCLGPGKLQKMSSNPEAQCPDLPVVEELHNSFKRWEQQPRVCPAKPRRPL